MAKKRFDKGVVFTAEMAAAAAIGTVVVDSLGVVAQKHSNGLNGEGEWYLAQNWEGSVDNKSIGSGHSKYLATVPMTLRRFD